MAPREEPEELRHIPPELISPNPLQPRRRFDEEPLLALAESIKLRGVLQPVLVRPVAGGLGPVVAAWLSRQRVILARGDHAGDHAGEQRAT